MTLAERAQTCSEVGDHRLASQLVELAAAASDDPAIWRHRSAIYRARAEHETSLMAKGVFNEAARSGDEHAAALGEGLDDAFDYGFDGIGEGEE